VSSRFSTVID